MGSKRMLEHIRRVAKANPHVEWMGSVVARSESLQGKTNKSEEEKDLTEIFSEREGGDDCRLEKPETPRNSTRWEDPEIFGTTASKITNLERKRVLSSMGPVKKQERKTTTLDEKVRAFTLAAEELKGSKFTARKLVEIAIRKLPANRNKLTVASMSHVLFSDIAQTQRQAWGLDTKPWVSKMLRKRNAKSGKAKQK